MRNFTLKLYNVKPIENNTREHLSRQLLAILFCCRIFEKFDKLYVLAEGQTIYRGTTMGLIPFLGSMGLECPSYHNPADFVMEVASGEHGTFTEKLVTAVANGKCNNLSEGSPSVTKKSATGPISLNNDIIKKQSEQVCQDEVKIYMTHDFISAAFELSSFPITTI